MTQNLTFPILHSDIPLRAAVAHKPEIRFMDQENGTVICSYIVSCDGTFDEMYSREARGIVFDKNHKVISRPLHKFFNLNQNPDVLYEKIDWSKAVRVMNKRDGSMIHTSAVKNANKFWPSKFNFDLKSKKSYTSDVAHQAKSFMMLADEAGMEGYGQLCNWCVDENYTAIFEWTSPIARIVVGYSRDDLQLLHIRDNVTGKYLPGEKIHWLGNLFKVPVVEDAIKIDQEWSGDFADVIAAIKNNAFQELIDSVEGIEGWVIQFENGDMIKVKTAWYMERHRAMTFLRVRDIAEMTLNETLDDLKSVLLGEGCDITEINAIETKVVSEIDEIINSVNSIFEEHKNFTKKEMALNFGPAGKNNPYFKLIMNKFDGKEPDYKAFYERNYLRDRFDLTQLNLLQTTAETDE